MDREKVINEINELLNNYPVYIPEAAKRGLSDALSLLKEDCHNCKLECLLQKYDQLKEKYDKLLKEQEESIPISWLESYTRLKCMDYVHGIVLDLIKTWKSVK